jgi:hypothetical protein
MQSLPQTKAHTGDCTVVAANQCSRWFKNIQAWMQLCYNITHLLLVINEDDDLSRYRQNKFDISRPATRVTAAVKPPNSAVACTVNQQPPTCYVDTRHVNGTYQQKEDCVCTLLGCFAVPTGKQTPTFGKGQCLHLQGCSTLKIY